MQRATRHIRNKVIGNISHKTGRYGPASPAGQYPYLRQGQLRRSIATEVVEESGNIVGRVGSNLIYARYLELGARNAPRPFLANTLATEQATITSILSAPMN